MRVVPVSSIKGEAILAQDIYGEKGTILLKKGVSLTPTLIERITDNNVHSVYVTDGYSDTEIEDVIRPELRRKAAMIVKETFSRIEKEVHSRKNNTTDIRKLIDVKSMEKYIIQLKEVSENIIGDLVSNKNLMINLVDIKNLDTFTYDHSVNVAVMSIIVAIEARLSRHELQPLFMASLLHDIGKTMVPQDILSKKDQLTNDDILAMNEHPRLGYEYVKQNYNFSINVTNAIYQHHERINGTGYPRGLLGPQISKFAKIIGIVDTYDILTSDTPYSNAIPPSEALEMLMGSAGTLFDFEFVNVFTRKVIPFPNGTLIKLTSDMVGVVEEQNENFPLRPKVRIVNKTSPRCGECINLMKDTTVVILGHQYENPNL